jgi:hypothetical protein
MKLKAVSGTVVAMGLVLSMATLAEAQATRTWISGVGDDVNPCSRTAPCKTFAGAISKTAENGYINVLDPGGFGALTITKSITIDGGDAHAGMLSTIGGTGVIINAANKKVTLRNLSIEGAATGGKGIRIMAANAVHVENCVIVNWTLPGISMETAAGSSSFLYVTDTVISQTQGISITNGRATIDNLRSDANTFGVRAQVGALVTVRNSTIGGGSTGVGLSTPSSIVNIENSVITNNVTGIDASGGSTVRVSNSSILSNSMNGLFNDGLSTITSLSGNTVQGNPTPGAFTGAAIPKQ